MPSHRVSFQGKNTPDFRPKETEKRDCPLFLNKIGNWTNHNPQDFDTIQPERDSIQYSAHREEDFYPSVEQRFYTAPARDAPLENFFPENNRNIPAKVVAWPCLNLPLFEHEPKNEHGWALRHNDKAKKDFSFLPKSIYLGISHNQLDHEKQPAYYCREPSSDKPHCQSRFFHVLAYNDSFSPEIGTVPISYTTMRRKKFPWKWGLSLFLLCFTSAAFASSFYAGSPNEIFQFGADARAMGMGNAYTAIAGGASSLYYNPAGLGLLNGPDISAMQASLIGGASYEDLSYAQNFSKIPGAWGVEALNMGISGAEQRDSQNNLTGSFGFQETGYGAGFGFRNVVIPNLSLGGSFQGLSRSLGGSSSDMLYGGNLGAQYGPFFDNMVTAGVVLQNGFSGAQNTYDRLPTVVRTGLAITPMENLLISADYGDDGDYGIGAEYRIWMFAIRAGYIPEGLTFGAGIYYKSLEADVAMVNDPVFGLGERFSLNYRFSGKKKEKPLTAYTDSYLKAAKKELNSRNYLNAQLALEEAMGIDPSQVPQQWKEKLKLLESFNSALDLKERPDEITTLRATDQAALLAQKSIFSYLDGHDGKAMIWASVAAGSGNKTMPYIDFVKTMAYLTSMKISDGDLLPPAEFVSKKMETALQAIYQKRFADAVKDCQQAITINPDESSAWTRLGSAYFAWGHKKEAKKAYEKALSLDPKDVNLKKFMEMYIR